LSYFYFFVEGGLLNFINCNPDVLGMCWPMGEALAWGVALAMV
jgi:hypothetical protein